MRKISLHPIYKASDPVFFLQKARIWTPAFQNPATNQNALLSSGIFRQIRVRLTIKNFLFPLLLIKYIFIRCDNSEHEGKYVKCLEQIFLPICAPISELPSNYKYYGLYWLLRSLEKKTQDLWRLSISSDALNRSNYRDFFLLAHLILSYHLI